MFHCDVSVLSRNRRASDLFECGAELQMLVVERRLFHAVLVLSAVQPSGLRGRLLVNKLFNEVFRAR